MANTLLDHLRDLLDEASAGLPGVTAKRMFGCHALFANGNIYAIVWKAGRLGIKVTDPARNAELMGLPGSEPWTPGKVSMSNWILAPEGFHDDPDEVRRWVKVAHGLAASSPPKAKAKPRAAKKTTGRPARPS